MASASKSKASRVSRLARRHGGSSAGDLSSAGSLGSDSSGEIKTRNTRNTRTTKRSFSFKSVRKSFGAAASFGMMNKCRSTPKMKFSKLNSPELEALSFPTSTASDGDNETSSLETKETNKGEPLPPAINYPIPYHTKALIGGLTAFFLSQLPSLESLDEIANIETFTQSASGNTPLTVIIGVRLLFAVIMLGNALSVFLYGDWEADTMYLPGSKLRVVKRIPFQGALVANGGSVFGGIKCCGSFTLWCWIVEGTAFLLAAMIPLFHFVPDTTISPWVFRIAIVLWQVAASVSILVSAVVKYALWPLAMEQGENVKLLKATGALLQHNLNSIAALVEVGLLGGLPVRLCDFAWPPLYGIAYLLFKYYMMNKWTDIPNQGPQFFYPFFDTTLGATTSLSLIALLAVLSLSFCIFVGAETLLLEAEKYIAVVPMAAIGMLSMMVCRVKD